MKNKKHFETGQEKQETSQHLPEEVKSKASLKWAKNSAATPHPAPVTTGNMDFHSERSHCDSLVKGPFTAANQISTVDFLLKNLWLNVK